MASPRAVAAAIRRDTTKFIEERVIAIVDAVTSELTLATPKDTGWASVNWSASIGGESLAHPNNTEAAQSREVRASLVFVEAAAQQSNLNVVRRDYRLSKGNVYMTNHVPYTQKLDDTHTPGFVAAAIARGVGQAG